MNELDVLVTGIDLALCGRVNGFPGFFSSLLFAVLQDCPGKFWREDGESFKTMCLRNSSQHIFQSNHYRY